MIKIYGIKLIGDTRVRYVGQTRKSISKRLSEHVAAARTGGKLPLMRWLTKHAVDHEIVELDSIESESGDPGKTRKLANEKEIELIAHYRSLGQADLNVPAGGWNPRPAGWKHSDESKQKISQNCSMRNPDIAKRSGDSRKGMKPSAERVRKIQQGLTRSGMHEKLSSSAKKGWEKRRKRNAT